MISSTVDIIQSPSNAVLINRIGTNDSLALEGEDGSRQIESVVAIQEMRRSHFRDIRKEPSILAPSLGFLQEELQLQ